MNGVDRLEEFHDTAGGSSIAGDRNTPGGEHRVRGQRPQAQMRFAPAPAPVRLAQGSLLVSRVAATDSFQQPVGRRPSSLGHSISRGNSPAAPASAQTERQRPLSPTMLMPPPPAVQQSASTTPTLPAPAAPQQPAFSIRPGSPVGRQQLHVFPADPRPVAPSPLRPAVHPTQSAPLGQEVLRQHLMASQRSTSPPGRQPGSQSFSAGQPLAPPQPSSPCQAAGQPMPTQRPTSTETHRM